MSHPGERHRAMTDRWIAECRRILAESRAHRATGHVRSAPRVAEPTPSTWTPSSVLDDVPLPDEPPEEDWR